MNPTLSPAHRFRQLLANARRRLSWFAWMEIVLAAGIGAALGLGSALWLIDVLAFSLTLRIGLWVWIGIASFLGAFGLGWRRLRPLQRPPLVASRMEEAAQRLGIEMQDAVRGAVDLLAKEQDDSLGRSRALCDAHIAETTATLENQNVLASVGGVALGLAVPTLLSASFIVGIAGTMVLVFPEALQKRLDRLFDDNTAAMVMEARAANRLPLVTDLVLTLRFPAYMTQEDQRIPGTSGDVAAPRGTEIFVEGRADRAVAAAALLLGNQEIALVVQDGRTLSGRFLVMESTTYRFRLQTSDGDEELDPVAHRITLIPDQVPKIDLSSPDADQTVKVEDRVEVQFSAKDDYGIQMVRIVVRRQGSQRAPFEKEILQLDNPLRELKGGGSFRIEETGARPGDRLSVYLEALDNDTVSGPKAGRSRTRVLTVFSAAEHHRKLIEMEEALLDRMVHLLADELENPIDREGTKQALEEQRKTVQAHQVISDKGEALLEALGQVLLQLAEDRLSPDAVRRALANMRVELEQPLRQKRNLLKSSKSNLSEGKGLLTYAFRSLFGQQYLIINRLERHALYLEDLLNTQRIQEAQQIADDLRRTQKDLRELLSAYKEAPSDALRDQLLEEISRLREQMQSLMKRLAELEREVPDEYLNQEAFETHEMMQQAQDLDRMIEEGKLEEAVEMLQKMAEQTQKLVDELDESSEEYGGEEYRELREKLERFGQELSALTAKQQELLHRNQRLLDAAREKAKQKLAEKLDAVLAQLKEKVKNAQAELDEVDSDALFSMEQEDIALSEARVEDLKNALEAGDLEDAMEAAAAAKAAAQSAERALADRTRGRFGSRNKSTLDARDRLQKARPLLEDVHAQLAELMPDPAAQLSPSQRQALRKDAEEQAQLQESANQLAKQMAEIGQEMPIFGPGHQAQMQQAGQSMRQAGKSLANDDLRGARKDQQAAMQSLDDLQKSLEEMSQGSGGGGIPMPLPGGNAPGSERSGQRGQRNAKDKVEIPGAEDFQVPDAFRRDILDAMREGAPAEWKGEVKRYYEELVK